VGNLDNSRMAATSEVQTLLHSTFTTRPYPNPFHQRFADNSFQQIMSIKAQFMPGKHLLASC